MPCHHRVSVLYRRHRAHGMSPPQVVFICLRDAPVSNFAFLDQISHHLRHSFRLYVGVDSVLEIQVNVIGSEPFQRSFHRFADGLRAGIRHQRQWNLSALLVKPQAKFRGDYRMILYICQCLAHQRFIYMGVVGGTVHLSGIKKSIAQIKGATD